MRRPSGSASPTSASTTTRSPRPRTRSPPALADGPRELVIKVKETLAAMATIDSHDEAVSRELAPQVWSTQKPWFRERLAALQAKISSKS